MAKSPAHKPNATLTPNLLLKLRLETDCSDETVRRWAKGDVTNMRHSTQRRLARAAMKLGIPVAAP
jgi:hypothetical protein